MKNRKVHLVNDRFDPLTLCGKKADRNVDTEDPNKLTCKRCKKMMFVPLSERWGAK